MSGLWMSAVLHATLHMQTIPLSFDSKRANSSVKQRLQQLGFEINVCPLQPPCLGACLKAIMPCGIFPGNAILWRVSQFQKCSGRHVAAMFVAFQVRDQIEKENVSQQARKGPPPLPPPGQKVDIKVSVVLVPVAS